MENNKEFTLTEQNLDIRKLALSVFNFAHRKPGFEISDYVNPHDVRYGNYEAIVEGRKSYQADYRYYKKFADRNRNYSPEALYSFLYDVPAQELVRMLNSGRVHVDDIDMNVGVTVGQYWCTEYQVWLNDFIEDVKKARVFA